MSDNLLLGIDGGGTKTVACLALSESKILGRGVAGPSNPRTCGELALRNLDEAIDAAFFQAQLASCRVTAACLGLAGVDREEDRAIIEDWANRCQLADRVQIVHDALPLLYTGTLEGHGIALIAGTGSFCFGRTANGDSARCGGWGPLFGDEGSGYAISITGLRAAARSADGRGPTTTLLDRFLQSFEARHPSDLISILYRESITRAMIAERAVLVFEEAQRGDQVAEEIVQEAASQLASHVVALYGRLDFEKEPIVLAVTGGLLVGQPLFRERALSTISQAGVPIGAVEIVSEPVLGAIRMAQRLLSNGA